MSQCVPCRMEFRSLTAMGRHMTRVHGVNGEQFWRRVEQAGDRPIWALRSAEGRWYVMVQDTLML